MAGDTKVAVIAALVGNTLIAGTKFVAAIFTGSSAMLSEGIHSLVDVGNQILLLIGLHQAKKKPNAEHPYGFGKELYFYSFIVAILLFAFGGGLSVYEGFKHLMHPEPIRSPYINYIVLSFSFIFEGAAWYIAYKQAKKQFKKFHLLRSINQAKDPAIIVVLLEDSAAMVGLVFALIGVTVSTYFDLPIFDGIASILIGLVLLIVAIWLAYESKSLLVGESASKETIRKIKKIVLDSNDIVDAKNIMTMHMSPTDILLNLEVDFEEKLSSTDVEQSVASLEKQIKEAIPEVSWVFIAAKSFAR